MTEIEQRVARCFTNVFPVLAPGEISAASTSSLAAWDSVAQVTLLSSLAEEFGKSFELEDFEELVSYRLIVDHMENQSRNA